MVLIVLDIIILFEKFLWIYKDGKLKLWKQK